MRIPDLIQIYSEMREVKEGDLRLLGADSIKGALLKAQVLMLEMVMSDLEKVPDSADACEHALRGIDAALHCVPSSSSLRAEDGISWVDIDESIQDVTGNLGEAKGAIERFLAKVRQR